MPLLHDSEPGDGLAGFPPILARTVELNEPRVPIGELGFTEGYALLDVGEDTQKITSMHAAQYTTTSISQALTCASKRVSELRPASSRSVSNGCSRGTLDLGQRSGSAGTQAVADAHGIISLEGSEAAKP